jgi:hypothetical protein
MREGKIIAVLLVPHYRRKFLLATEQLLKNGEANV